MISLYQQHVARWKDCQGCALCHGRTRIVLARGRIPCDVLFIGEAPGVSEDVLGQPFVGPAGKLLDRIIAEAMPVDPEADALGAPDPQLLRTCFTNLVACFPKEEKEAKINEPPVEAVKACAGRLKEFVRIVKPRLIALVGQLSKKHVQGQADFSIKEDYSLEWLKPGEFLKFTEIVHPASILRQPIAQQGMARKRCVVTLSNAFQELLP